MTQSQALTKALVLAITAPDDEKAQMAIDLSIELAMRLNAADVEKCKANALLIAYHSQSKKAAKKPL